MTIEQRVADRYLKKTAGRMDRDLQRLLDQIEGKLSQQVSRVTMNRGHEAHQSLDKLDDVAGRARSWLEDQSAHYDGRETEMNVLEEAGELIDAMKEKIEEVQRELGDRDFHEDDADEDEIMEYMEEQVYDLETIAEGFGKLR